MLLGGLVGSLQQGIADNPAIPPDVREQVGRATEEGIDFVPSDRARAALEDAGLGAAEVDAIVAEYEDAQVTALKLAMLPAAALAFLGLLFTRRLPVALLGPDPPAAGALSEPG